MTLVSGLFLIVVIAAFIVGWVYAPKGVLTKITSTIWGSLLLAYETMSEQLHLLREIIPPDAAPWFIGGFVALTFAAAFRPKNKA